jgi:hypothetical protein
MALWAVAFLGTTPVGGPIIGFIGQHAGPRVGLGVGGTAALVAAAVGWWHLVRRAPDEASPVPPAPELATAGAPAGR